MEAATVHEPAVAEPAVEAAEPELAGGEINRLDIEYPGTRKLLNLLATGGPGKQIFTPEELNFYSKAIKIYTQDTVTALKLLFPPTQSDNLKLRQTKINGEGVVEPLPDISFYRGKRGANAEAQAQAQAQLERFQTILQVVVGTINESPRPSFPKNLEEVRGILIDGVKRLNGKRDGIVYDYSMFYKIIGKINTEIPNTNEKELIIDKINNAMQVVQQFIQFLEELGKEMGPYTKYLKQKLHEIEVAIQLEKVQEQEQPRFNPTPPPEPAPAPAAARAAPAPAPTAKPQGLTVKARASAAATKAVASDRSGNFKDAILQYRIAARLLESTINPRDQTKQPFIDKINEYLGRAQFLEASALESVSVPLAVPGDGERAASSQSGTGLEPGFVIVYPEPEPESGPDEPGPESGSDMMGQGMDWASKKLGKAAQAVETLLTGVDPELGGRRSAKEMAKINAGNGFGGGGKRKRKHKRTRKIKRSKHKLKHSKHKHKRSKLKKTLKRKYKKNKGSKRR